MRQGEQRVMIERRCQENRRYGERRERSMDLTGVRRQRDDEATLTSSTCHRYPLTIYSAQCILFMRT
jgi:hypothetical protein